MSLAKSDLLAALKSRAAELGLKTHDKGHDGLSGETESIRSKWFLGGRKVSYRMSCQLDEAEHTAHFREAVTEKSWGLPPPALTVETTSVNGWERSGAQTVHTPGGSGSVDYGRVREELKPVVAAAGWQFHFDGGHMP